MLLCQLTQLEISRYLRRTIFCGSLDYGKLSSPFSVSCAVLWYLRLGSEGEHKRRTSNERTSARCIGYEWVDDTVIELTPSIAVVRHLLNLFGDFVNLPNFCRFVDVRSVLRKTVKTTTTGSFKAII